MQNLLNFAQQLGPLLGGVVVLLGAVGALCTALSGVLNLALGVFPKLKGGPVDHAANLVEVFGVDVGKGRDVIRAILTKFWPSPDSSRAVTPPDRPKIAPVVLFAVILSASLLPRSARAEVDYSVGPTIPLVLIDLKSGATAQVLSGAGAQLSVTSTAFEREFLGRAWDLFDVVLMGFGTRVQPSGGDAFGQFSAAAGVCTLSSLICAAFGKHLVDTSGAIEGNTGWFLGLNLSINFALAPTQPQPSDSSSNSVAGLPRGNTLYWGWL